MNTTIDELETKLKTYSINERYNTLAETRYWCSQYKDLADEAILKLRAQALLSQGEPVGYLRFITNETVKFIPKDNFKLVLKGASPIITSYPDLPVYTAQPSTEALQKDKAELYKALVYENEALKAELTHAKSYKADAERYRYMTSRDLDEIIDQAMKENKLTNGETK